MRARSSPVLLSLLLVSLGAGLIFGAGSGKRPPRRPLDLPTKPSSRVDDDEDFPEVIRFYGFEYEGDAFFWCLDRSLSMNSGEKLLTLKQEMRSAIDQLSKDAEFGIVSFASGATEFSDQPQRADLPTKRAARAWVDGLVATGDTNLTAGASSLFDVANQCQVSSKRVIMVGDGLPNDVDAALEAIGTHNDDRTPIDCILIGNHDRGREFFEQLALYYEGTFRQVTDN